MGNSVFLNRMMEPHADQWVYLASIRRMSPATVDRIAREAARQGKIVGVRCSALSEDRDDDTLWERVRTCQPEEVPSAKLVPEEVQVVLA